MRKAIIFAVAFIFAAHFLVVALAQQSVGNGSAPTGAGNGGANCQVNPGLSAGNDPTNSCENTKQSNGYLGSNGSTTACGTTANNSYGNGVNWLGIADPGYSNHEIIAVPVPTTSPGAGATAIQFCDYNRSTSTLTVGGVYADQTAGVPGVLCYQLSNAHTEPALNAVGGGYFLGTACGTNQSGGNNPHKCLSASGAAGTSTYCAPVFWGDCITTSCGGAHTTDMSLASNSGFLAGSGPSEGTVTHFYGGATTSGIITISGQNTSDGTVLGSNNGSQAYMTLRDSGTTAGQWYEDTACGVGSAINATATNGTTSGSGGWNVVTGIGGGATPGGSGITQVCNGAEQFSLPQHGSILDMVDATSDVAGTLSITLPAHGAWTSGICKFTMTGSGTTDGPNLVAALRNGTGWASGSAAECTSSGTYWDSMVATTAGCGVIGDSNCHGASSTQFSVSVEPINANPNAMSRITLSTTAGTVVGSSADMRTLTSGDWNHFDYGTMQLLTTPAGTAYYCALLDQQEIRAPVEPPIGIVNSWAFYMSVFCSRGPDVSATGAPATLGQWVWGDVGMLNPAGPPDGFTFIVSPATLGAPTTGATPSPAPYEQFVNGSSWNTCTSAATPCTTYRDATGTATNLYGPVKPCTCTPWTGFVPYIYQTSNRNESLTSGGFSDTSGYEVPVGSAYWMSIDMLGYLDIVRACPNNIASSGPEMMVCFEQITPFSAVPQTVTEACVDCTNTIKSRFLLQPAIVRAPSGDLVIMVGDQSGGLCVGTQKPCFIQYVNKWNPITLAYAGTWTKTVLGACPTSSLTQGAAISTQVQASWDGMHMTAVCWPTAGTTAYQFDLYTGGL